MPMKKQFLSGIIIMAFTACTQLNSSSDKVITKGNDTLAEMDISVSKVDMLNTLAETEELTPQSILFKASGTEPGWFAEFYNNKIRIVLDYGKDSLIIDNPGPAVNEKEDYEYDVEDDKNKGKNIAILISGKSCTDAGSGDKKDRQVSIQYKGKVYKGCGSFIK